MRGIKRNIQRSIAAILTSALLLSGQAASMMSSIPVAKAAGTTYYVSNSGNDGGAGSELDPYRTITHALSVSVNGDTILIAAGTYDTYHGETFPLSLKSGVSVLGSGAGVTLIQRNGPVPGTPVISAISIGGNAILDGFTISGGLNSGNGGGLLIHDSTLTISNNIITRNTAAYGGGIHIEGDSNPAVHDNIISDNTYTTLGGGIYCALPANPTIFNNTIQSNHGGTGGGGIAVAGCSPSIYDNVISGNSASVGGGVYFDDSSSNIFNNVVVGNSAVGGQSANGGGFYVDDATPIIYNNTVFGNSAEGNGGGVYNTGEGTVPIIFNCILWGNGDDLFDCTAAYSDIEDGDTGEGNISGDPLFVGGGSYDLLIGSPCINAGTASYLGHAAPGSDILNTQRAQGTGFDMGAFEFIPPVAELPFTGT